MRSATVRGRGNLKEEGNEKKMKNCRGIGVYRNNRHANEWPSSLLSSSTGRGGKKCHFDTRQMSELQTTLSSTFTSALLTSLYPRSTISIALHVLSLDGALLAACVNAATLALVDAGVPMVDYMVACTAGSTTAAWGAENEEDPLLDLNGTEEGEMPFLTIGTLGAGEERVGVLVMESRVPMGSVEGMMAVGVDGCKQVREILDGVVRAHGKRILESVPE